MLSISEQTFTPSYPAAGAALMIRFVLFVCQRSSHIHFPSVRVSIVPYLELLGEHEGKEKAKKADDVTIRTNWTPSRPFSRTAHRMGFMKIMPM